MYLVKKTCMECGVTFLGDHYAYDYICAECKRIEENKKRLKFIEDLDAPSIEEQLFKIKEMLYQLSNKKD